MTEPRPGVDPATSTADLSDRQWALMGGMGDDEVYAYARSLAREVVRLRDNLADVRRERDAAMDFAGLTDEQLRRIVPPFPAGGTDD